MVWCGVGRGYGGVAVTVFLRGDVMPRYKSWSKYERPRVQRNSTHIFIRV